jgi:hypothetical protein
MPSDHAVCLANAKMEDPDAKLCRDVFGEARDPCMTRARLRETLYLFCYCQPPYNRPPCPGANTPIIVPYNDGRDACYCCCTCLAWGTEIAVPGGFKPIQEFEVGDPVMVTGLDLKWQESVVEFSDGVPPAPEHGKFCYSIYVALAPTKLISLVVTPDHVFLVPGGKLKRAEALEPGVDELIDAATGKPVPVVGRETGMFYGGLHHIAVTQEVARALDGHLINVHGVVSADWSLQNADLTSGPLAGAQAVGTAKRPPGAETRHVEADRFHAVVKGVDLQAARHALFKPLAASAARVPAHARRFFSEQQARDILEHAPQSDIPVEQCRGVTERLFGSLRGFYPDVVFAIDDGETMPNAYSWRTDGRGFVIVGFGLLRIVGLNVQTLAVMIGHELGHLYGGAPLTPDGDYSCEGQADYAATAAILMQCLQLPAYLQWTPLGIDGVAWLFSFVTPPHRGGVPINSCEGLSIDCRMAALRAGWTRALLPECAGGPKLDYLKLVSAVARQQLPDATEIAVTFGQPINHASALPKEQYSLAPAAAISAVRAPRTTPTIVRLTANLEPGQAYIVTVAGVLSDKETSFEGGSASINVIWATP